MKIINGVISGTIPEKLNNFRSNTVSYFDFDNVPHLVPLLKKLRESSERTITIYKPSAMGCTVLMNDRYNRESWLLHSIKKKQCSNYVLESLKGLLK